MIISDKARNLRNEYKKKFNEIPRGWKFEEELMEEYERYLEEQLRTNKK